VLIRFHISLVIALALAVGPALAQDQAAPTMSQEELQKLVLEQQKQLKKLQELVEQQDKTIQDQTEAIRGLRTQLDQLSMDTTGQAPELSEDELALRERLTKVE
jgi:septal ring factor EnvC (AmiA/AmiB activator)